MIQRIFHPIGQGAFYSERHENYNVVYDCGNWKNTKVASLLVKGSFAENEVIDYLFISHFDYDHVNKIPDLKSNFIIKNVVLPLLHDEEKIIISNFYKILGHIELVELVENPQHFFGEVTRVIYVKRYNHNDNNLDDKEVFLADNSILISDWLGPLGVVNSGSILKIDKWIFIPYNFEISTRVSELENAFVRLGLDISKFKNDLSYMISNRKKIKKAYKSLKGGINQNSMVVYSGPENNEDSFLLENNYRLYCSNCILCSEWCRQNIMNQVGCIYTGDFDLNIKDLKAVFSKYWSLVGTIQVPHHGDLKSFNSSVLAKHVKCFPISVGCKNSYGHPSNKVVLEIMKNYSSPYLVTEQSDSILIQNIWQI